MQFSPFYRRQLQNLVRLYITVSLKIIEMRITSLEIKQHEFERSFRGYNVDEVNQFLGEIAQEWDKMFNEIKMLKMQLDIAEKEASKLRDVEMTLIKTLRTAEDTSSRIAENAQLEAARKLDQAEAEATRTVDAAKQEAAQTVDEANRKAAQLIREAEHTGKQLVLEAETKAQDIQKTSEREIAELDARYNALESRKNELLSKLKTYHSDLAKLLEGADLPAVIEQPIISAPQVEESPIEDDFSSGVSLPSAVNDINLESTKEEDKTDLEVIEGIGPKIKEILNDAGIHDFRTLATTPEYRLRDILSAAGSIYATHDPSTWNEQALLAENGQWDKLEELKGQLVAGRAPEVTTPTVDGANTEEMLDKVNKVKAAIRKAMVDKNQEEKPKSGSFFDSI
jgi:DivIVA domain-containing protein